MVFCCNSKALTSHSKICSIDFFAVKVHKYPQLQEQEDLQHFEKPRKNAQNFVYKNNYIIVNMFRIMLPK